MTTPSNETKELMEHALESYYHGVLDGRSPPRYSTEAHKIAEDWMKEQETSEEERMRLDKENGEKMKGMITAALSSYEYKILDDSDSAGDAEYEILRATQKWTENLDPGKDIA